MWESGEEVPDEQGGFVEFEFIPPALYWKRWCDRYGLPKAGGWINQPALFMKEIDAARRGEDMFQKEHQQQADQTQLATLLSLIRGTNE